jgi:uncharacterized membrane protein
VFGLLDWTAIPAGTRAKQVGAVHGLGNVVVVVVVVLSAISWLVRMGAQDWEPSALAMVFSFVGVALAGFTGWLGGELVYRLRVGIDDDAGLDAPSSVSRGRSAGAG